MDKNFWNNKWNQYSSLGILCLICCAFAFPNEGKKEATVELLEKMHLQYGDRQLECDEYTYWYEIPALGFRNSYYLHVKIHRPSSRWRKEKYVQIHFPHSLRKKCEKYLWAIYMMRGPNFFRFNYLVRAFKEDGFKIKTSLGQIDLYLRD